MFNFFNFSKIKQRILDRMNDSIKENIKNDDEESEQNELDSNTNEYNLDKSQSELLNAISNYADFYNPNVEVNMDTKVKFVYTLHALNHALKYF